jgi:chemotaxis protein MotA
MRFSLVSLTLTVIALAVLISSALVISGFLKIIPSTGAIGTLNLPSFGVIIGGLLLSSTLSYSDTEIKSALSFTKNILMHPSFGRELERRDLQELFHWQKELKANYNIARNELTKTLNNTFEGYLFTLASTNYEPEKIQELGLIKARERFTHKKNLSALFDQLSDTSPAYGMLGTLVGLIFMLQRFENVKDLGEGLSFALMTTFYGLIFAYVIFTPLSKKAALYAEKSLKRDLFILNGFVMILKGEEPLVVFDYLCADRDGFIFDDELSEIGLS